LRYGENPHQKAAIYRQGTPPQGLAAARQLQGKELSFNNYLDLESTWSLCQEFQAPFCAIIKHTNPCGASCAGTLAEAYRRALACDPVAAFGSVIGFNRCVDRETAEEMSSLFVEAVIAPSYDKEALEVFGEKKGLRVMEMGVGARAVAQMDFKKISGGFLVQDKDLAVADEGAIKTVTSRSASEVELRDLLFAMRICKHVKSNAIVYARDEQTVGVGAGQMSRVDSARLAAQKARLPLAGCVMASDAFFPFRDGIDEAAKAGVTAVIQPGGSVRDEEVVQAANEHGMAMLFTGMRHFKH
jgi:phosphoribosylaminoimidazolecarboxamide formyltransferase/IMP cyclohydrolase